MPNIIEAVSSVIKSFTENGPKSPMTVSEVTNCWLYLAALQEMLNFELIGLNTTQDKEVRNMLQDAIKLCESQVNTLKKLMQEEGIPLSPTSPEKPKSEPEAVPLGVKFTDEEIVNFVALKIGLANIGCATGETNALRNDIGLMWAGFQTEILTFAATLKQMLIQRGWMKIPPFYHSAGIPKQ